MCTILAVIVAKYDVPGYDTTVVLQPEKFWLSYTLDKPTKTVKIAYQVAADEVANGDGWAALGFSSNSRMVGSQAIIFVAGKPQLYTLGGFSPMLVTPAPNQASFQSGTPAMEQENNKRVTYTYDLKYDSLEPGTFNVDKPTPILHAYGSGGLMYHGVNRGVTSVTFM
jgi:hypothetical protein